MKDRSVSRHTKNITIALQQCRIHMVLERYFTCDRPASQVNSVLQKSYKKRLKNTDF